MSDFFSATFYNTSALFLWGGKWNTRYKSRKNLCFVCIIQTRPNLISKVFFNHCFIILMLIHFESIILLQNCFYVSMLSALSPVVNFIFLRPASNEAFSNTRKSIIGLIDITLKNKLHTIILNQLLHTQRYKKTKIWISNWIIVLRSSKLKSYYKHNLFVKILLSSQCSFYSQKPKFCPIKVSTV